MKNLSVYSCAALSLILSLFLQSCSNTDDQGGGTNPGTLSNITSDLTTWCLTGDGQTYCAGVNIYGQIGDGTTTDRFSWTPAPTANHVIQMAAGFSFTCALSKVGSIQSIKCWGRNGVGGNIITTPTTINVPNVNNIISISAGEDRLCLLYNTKTVSCVAPSSSSMTSWTFTNVVGANNTEFINVRRSILYTLNAAGTSDAFPAYQGSATADFTNSVQFSGGMGHECSVTTTGTVQCRGENNSGQLGNGTMSGSPSLTPVNVTGLINVMHVSAGNQFTCALTTGAEVYCWGNNTFNQLGLGAGADSGVARKVTGLSNISAISAGSGGACAIKSNSEVWCWGTLSPSGSATPARVHF